jgi:hypothetical protein
MQYKFIGENLVIDGYELIKDNVYYINAVRDKNGSIVLMFSPLDDTHFKLGLRYENTEEFKKHWKFNYLKNNKNKITEDIGLFSDIL